MDLKIGAAYIRVSSDDQMEYSPDSQLKVIREYAKREGYVIPSEYVYQDDGISGKTASKRPAFRLMIATAKEGKPPFDSIFVWKYSRFARNQEEAIMYKNLLRKKGVSVKSVSEPSSDSPFSSLIERIIEWMDEYYLINLSEEVRRGMKEKATRGEPMSIAPYGYQLVDGALYPDDHADTVRYIFAQYAGGKGFRALARELGDRGIRTARGNVPDNRWIKYILGNPVYIGKVRWSTDGAANYGRANYNGNHVMIVDGKHDPLIDLETWEKVQTRLSSRDTEVKYQRQGDNGVFALKGLVRCDACGSTLTLCGNKYSRYLQCHKYGRGQCKVSHAVTLKKATDTVTAALEEAMETKAITFAPRPPQKGKVIRDWDKLIVSEENRLKRAKEALLDGVFTTQEYAAVKRDIEDNLEKLTAARLTDQAESESAPNMDDFVRKVSQILVVLKSQEVSETAKNEALRSIVDRVVFHKPSGRFDIFFTH